MFKRTRTAGLPPEPAGAADTAVEGELILTGCSGLRGTFKGLAVLPPAASLTRVDFFQFGGLKSNIGKASLCLGGQFTFLQSFRSSAQLPALLLPAPPPAARLLSPRRGGFRGGVGSPGPLSLGGQGCSRLRSLDLAGNSFPNMRASTVDALTFVRTPFEFSPS